MKYTGRAETFTFNGVEYHKEKDGKTKNIPGLTKDIALHMINQSRMHAFEEGGEDLEEKVTTPSAARANTAKDGGN